MSTKPPSGTRDFLPDDIRRREYVIGVVRDVYERYGFEPLETPAFENIETLLGKYGEEGNKLIFKILKRGEHEASGEADLALRYDLTVPLARVVAQYQNELPRFFKRYQIQPVWRADRPARGRFREFYQCDIDAIGSTSPVVEAELLAAVSEVLTRLGFEDFVIRLNHRRAADGAARARRRAARRSTATRWSRSTSSTRSARTACAKELAARGIDGGRGGRLLTFFDAVADGTRRQRSTRLERWSRRWRPTRSRASTRDLLDAGRADGRRPACRASTRAWRAGCHTTRARSWKSPCRIWPAASAAAAGTTT